MVRNVEENCIKGFGGDTWKKVKVLGVGGRTIPKSMLY